MILSSGAKHRPVLLKEVIDGLDLSEGRIVVDATLGGAGYSSAFCKAVGTSGILIGLDRDTNAVLSARKALDHQSCAFHLFEENFRNLDTVLARAGILSVDAIAFDLGMSSIQLENSGRGFSFQKDEPLLMTFSDHPKDSDITAAQVVNNWSEESIANVLFGYGEETSSRKIAKAIVSAREEKDIKTSKELADIVANTISRKGKTHPATRTFQALRIAVNDEVASLEEGLEKGFKVLKGGGRMAAVSFHSIEDRVVKTIMAEAEKKGLGTRITKKPITPTDEEVEQNPRSRSAKLRIFEKS